MDGTSGHPKEDTAAGDDPPRKPRPLFLGPPRFHEATDGQLPFGETSEIDFAPDTAPPLSPKGLFTHEPHSLSKQPLHEPLPVIDRPGQLPRILGLVLSGVWLAGFTYYVTSSVGWEQLMQLLPQEFGGFVSGAFLPLAMMWMFIVYLDRGAQLRSEASALHQHLQRLTYPDQAGEARVKAVTDTLRRQAVDLTEASRQAVLQVEKVET